MRLLPMLVALLGVTRIAGAATCESLSSLSLPDTTITMAQIVALGEFTQPSTRGGLSAGSGRAGGGPFANLPSFCRIAATLKPTSDSDIKIEIWLQVRVDRVDRVPVDAGHGGRLLMYHGWSDGSVAPRASVNYYNSVLKTMDGPAKTSSWVRLFMAPGMGHCGGGEGPNTFDMVTAIDRWVEQGKAPDQIIASHLTNGTVVRTRPLCPYPQVATYKGAGSIDEAANFVCK